MRVGLLFSGGTDSTLAALLLDRFYEVELCTAHFGTESDWEHAAETASLIGLPFQSVILDSVVADRAIDRIIDHGSARPGIQAVHMAALEAIAERNYDAIADGTRRDDRVPSVSRAQAQQLEAEHNVDYVAPLSGFGPAAVERLVSSFLDVTIGPSDEIDRPDYEAELRALCRERADADLAAEVFPTREQTAVTGIRGRPNEQVQARES